MRTTLRPVLGRLAGFTLIELLIALAVVGILATLALPSMNDRLVRSQIIEAAKLADVAKGPVAAAWAAKQPWPADNAAAGLPVPEKVVSQYISAVTVEAGAIHLRFGNQAMGTLKDKVLTLRPAVVADAPVVPVSWVCASAAPPSPMTVQGTDRTTVPARYLPLNCKAP